MAKAMELLRKLGSLGKKQGDSETAFDDRLAKLGGVRQVSVARSVLFKTGPSHRAA
jgi:hypothetical protein